MLIELDKADGKKVWVNPHYVVKVNPNTSATAETTADVHFTDGRSIAVKGSQAEVARKLNEAMMGQ